MPECAILFTTTTGNTKLACEYISYRIPQVDFHLFDMRDLSEFDPVNYSFFGFATYTDYQAPPKSFMDTIKDLENVERKKAFVLVTYAGMAGKTLIGMKDEVEKKGYEVVSGHGLRMPENYCPQRKKGFKGDENPDEKDLSGFRDFIRELGDMIINHDLKGKVKKKKLKVGFINSLIPLKVRKEGLKGMGKKSVDLDLCTRCGTCQKNCPYGAISMEDGPIFNESICHACFSCYNLCPVGAITCESLPSSEFQYPGPHEKLRNRMSY